MIIRKFESRTAETESFRSLRSMGKEIEKEAEKTLRFIEENRYEADETDGKIMRSRSVIRGFADEINNILYGKLGCEAMDRDNLPGEKHQEDIPGYRCFLEEKSIEINIPMLPGRGIKYIPGKHFYDYNSKLGAPVENVMRSALTEENFDPNLYSFKTIHFLFLYSTQSKNVADSDNHDTKNVQDAICGFFKTGDSGNTCRTVFSTEITDLIPQGTYIRVTPMNNLITENIEIIKYWYGKITEEK